MKGSLAIVAYRCSIDGSLSEKALDFQVRWFSSANRHEIRAWLIAEPLHCYLNPNDEKVCWELAEIIAIEPFDPTVPGQEVIGFITSLEELSAFANEAARCGNGRSPQRGT